MLPSGPLSQILLIGCLSWAFSGWLHRLLIISGTVLILWAWAKVVTMNKAIKYAVFLIGFTGFLWVLFRRLLDNTRGGAGVGSVSGWWNEIRFFSPSEFDSPDLPGSGAEMMQEAFVRMLDQARFVAGFPFVVNSGYRSEAHNVRVGGVLDSSHLHGLAADIHADNYHQLVQLVNALRSAGFKRIGQYYTAAGNYFVHVDFDASKPYQGEWAYERGKGVGLFVPLV